jgi:hypothetical protein
MHPGSSRRGEAWGGPAGLHAGYDGAARRDRCADGHRRTERRDEAVTEPDTGHTLTDGERAELERLRSQVAAREAPRRRSRTWPRTVVGYVLVALAALLAPLSVVSVWARGQVGDTDRYVQTVAPLASDPAVQSAVTTQLTNLVFQYLDVEGVTQQAIDAIASGDRVPPALADRLDALVVPIANGVRSFTQDQIGSLVHSEAFATAWTTANRSAHSAVLAALSGDTRAGVTIADNAVTVNLAPFITQVKQQLVDSGFSLASRIPAVNAQYTLFQSDDIGKVQRAYSLLDTLGYWLPFIVLAIFVLGAYVVPHHRRAAIVFGVAVTVTMLILASALAYVRHRYLDALPPQRSREANAAVFDAIVRFLREGLRSVALVALAVAIGAFFTGHSGTATTVRGWINSGAALIRLGLARAGLRLSGVTAAVAPRAAIVRAVLVVLAVVVLIFPAYLTPSYVLWTLLGLLVALFLLAIIVAPVPEPRAAAPAQRVPQPA